MQYYTKAVFNNLNKIDILSQKDTIQSYYKNIQKISTFQPIQIDIAKDLNPAIFSFNFGLNLLNAFIKINFDTFGVSVLDNFIKK